MFKPELVHHHQYHMDDRLEHRFSLLSWNVHKNNQSQEFLNYLHELNRLYAFDLLLFQEAKTDHSAQLDLKGYSYILAPNIQTKKALFGVLTATKSHYHRHRTYLTHVKETLWTTHKSVLFTHHLLPNAQELLVVNMHAINFMPNAWFKKEFDILGDALQEHEGPLILAGDFNTWNKKRMQYLNELTKRLDLSVVDANEGHHIKSLIKYKLDHIMYRGLDLVESKALNCGHISDHNPIYATFEIIKNN